MNRRALKYPVVAALFSAAFLFGNYVVDAYTYSGVSSTIDNITEDENDLIITNNSQISTSNDIRPNKVQKVTETITKSAPELIIQQNEKWLIMENIITIRGIPSKVSQSWYNHFINSFNSKDALDKFNKQYDVNVTISGSLAFDTSKPENYQSLCKNFTYNNGIIGYFYSGSGFGGSTKSSTSYGENINYKDTEVITKLDGSSINISNNSTLTSKGNVQTSKAINVTNNSYLKASGKISGGDIYSDKAIISTIKDSGESIITPGNITATGTLKSDTYVSAVSGVISGNKVYSGGDIVSTNSIKVGGLAKGNVLNVAGINASSAAITGNQSITGIFTTSSQAKLNGGAALGSKKITGLGAGTLSATSMEAVNGAQLNTIKQKLASAGKSYTAGSDIAISSANAISVAKTGAVKSGDTGIVTGGTVYTETNSLNTKLSGLKELVNSHQTTITSLQQQMGDLNQTISDINSNVASATSNLANQLKNCLKSDMGNLSAAGRTAIKTIVSDSLKSRGRQSSQSLTSPIATFETPSAQNTVTTKDVDSIHTSLKDKLDKSALSTVSENVDSNTKQIGVNADNIHTNTSSIESLKSGKADVSGSNIDASAYATKLGTGNVVKGDTGLVSGDTVYGALAGKADIGYVDSGIGMMENQMAGIRQQATHDINRVGAGASALASLHPSAYDASDKISFATGYGHYKNANTSALGTFYHPNEKTMVSVAGTIGNNDAMLSAGISIKLGMSDHVSKVMVTPKMFSAQQVTNENMKDHIDTQSERLHQIEMALQNR